MRREWRGEERLVSFAVTATLLTLAKAMVVVSEKEES